MLASFTSEDWTHRVGGRFDFVVSMQAVHEVYQVLTVPGLFHVCDHTPFDDSPGSIALDVTEQEQQQALRESRFANVHVELTINGLVLYAGERAV